MDSEEQYSDSLFVIEGSVLVGYMGDVGEVRVPDGVTEIGASAFYSRKNITSVTLPESVVRIGESAFAYCLGLEELCLPAGVREIGAHAFSNCRALRETVIPDGVEEIREGTFSGCTSLLRVSLPKALTRIEDLAFFDCRALARISLPACAGEIGEAAFGDCAALKRFDFPKGVTRLSSRVLAGCRALLSVGLPSSLESIGNSAFSACYALESLEIPKGVTHIGNGAFAYCTSLSRLCLPHTVESLGADCLEGVEPPIAVCMENPVLFSMLSNSGKRLAVSGFLSRYDEGAVTDEECDIYGAFIKKQHRGLARLLGESASLYRFLTARRLLPLSEVEGLLESVSSIEIKSLLLDYKNRELTPEVIQKMERARERRLERLLWGEGRTVADWKREFRLCKLPDGTYFIKKYIGTDAVAEVPARIGRTAVSTVGVGAFSGCAHLTGAVIADGVLNIQGGAFMECKSLEHVVLPASVAYIGEGAFEEQPNLTVIAPRDSYAARRLKESGFSVTVVEE